MLTSTSTIIEDRKTFSYRFLEGLIGYSSLSFLGIILLTSILNPFLASIFLIIYSFMWILKYTLNVVYTLYTYIQLRRWEKLDWTTLFYDFNSSQKNAIQTLEDLSHKYHNKIDFHHKLQDQIAQLKANIGTPFENPNTIKHVCIFSIYNENEYVLIKSLKCIYESQYDLKNLVVFVSQEGRYGEVNNSLLRDQIKKYDWINSHNISEINLETVYNDSFETLDYSSKEFADVAFINQKLTVIFTQHPDGLVGEIKGKASNEDWGGRQAALFLKSQKIDPFTVLVTSLDADSHIGTYFFHHLSYTYCATTNREMCGFQPIHSYSNNFYDTSLWPRQVATQTGLSNLTNLGIEGETPFFAIYSSSMSVLQQVNFWVRDCIGEDAMIFNKCLIHFEGKFRVIPFYGVFEGDAVEADDYIEAILSQYKQLQRWAWGGVEDFPYVFKHFFLVESGRKIDLRIRLRWIFLKFSNHFFWSSSPVIFSVGLMLPSIFGGNRFSQTQTAQNLNILSQYFAWISFIFIISFGYITFAYFATKANENRRPNLQQILIVGIQLLLSPFLYGFMGIPAIDAQIRGIRGKYLGYWVTPKK
jgi:Glycosyl transferase family group 2